MLTLFWRITTMPRRLVKSKTGSNSGFWPRITVPLRKSMRMPRGMLFRRLASRRSARRTRLISFKLAIIPDVRRDLFERFFEINLLVSILAHHILAGIKVHVGEIAFKQHQHSLLFYGQAAIHHIVYLVAQCDSAVNRERRCIFEKFEQHLDVVNE